MKNILSILANVITSALFFIVPSYSAAQQPSQLNPSVEYSARDSLRVEELMKMADPYRDDNAEKLFEYGNEALSISKRGNFLWGLARSHVTIGRGYYLKADYLNEIVHYEKAMEYYEQDKRKKGVVTCLSVIGAAYASMGNNKKGMEYTLKALKVQEELGDIRGMAISYVNLGGISDTSEKDLRVNYYQNAIKLADSVNFFALMAFADANLGSFYIDQKKFDLARFHLERAIQYNKDSMGASFPLYMLGKMYSKQKSFSAAHKFFDQAISIAEKYNDEHAVVNAMCNKAFALIEESKYEEAVSIFKYSLKRSETIQSTELRKLVFEGLTKAYSGLGKFREAYTYEVKHRHLTDSMREVNSLKEMQAIKFNAEIERKQIEIEKLNKEQELKSVEIQKQKLLSYGTIIIAFLLILFAIGLFRRYRFIKHTNQIIEAEKKKSDELLLNILPAETARELAESGSTVPKYYESATVLFTDFFAFSSISGEMTPQELVSELNVFFVAFDDIIMKHGLEKIKTIGDAYMCVGGVPASNNTHAMDAVQAALRMQEFMEEANNEMERQGKPSWGLRIGIHTGPLVAGVVGKIKYAYDIWGDTVNIASRMESNGSPGKINISSATFELIKSQIKCFHRGRITAKNVGEVDMYFVGTS